jgi:hypothetical protein
VKTGLINGYYIDRYITFEPYSPQFTRHTEAYFAQYPSGKILAVYSRGTISPLLEFLICKESNNGGKDWDLPYLFYDTPNQWDVQPNFGMYGDYLLFFYTDYKGYENVYDCKIRIKYKKESDTVFTDGGQLPFPAGYTLNGRNYFRLRGSGTLKNPNGRHINMGSCDIGNNAHWRCFSWYCSADKDPRVAGNWYLSNIMPMGTAIDYDEPTAVELLNGNVYALSRTGMGVFYSNLSLDGGMTWEAGVPTTLPCASISHGAPAFLLRVSFDPSVILLFHDLDLSHRYPLGVSVSLNECATWQTADILDNSTHNVQYPQAILLSNGDILVSWWDQITDAHEGSVGCLIKNRGTPPPPPPPPSYEGGKVFLKGIFNKRKPLEVF